MSNVVKKILYFTDSQITAKTPPSRTDSISTALMRKFYEIGLIAKANNVDFVVCGGDFFDIPRVSLKLAGTFTQIIKDWGVDLYVVPGNHDMYGYTISNIDQTMLGFMSKTDVVKLLLKGEQFTFPTPNFDIVLEGQEYHKDIDHGINDDYRMSPSLTQNSTVNILVPHGMLVEKPFIGDTYSLIQDVAYRTDANVILGSHYHPGWPTQVVNNVLFYNPGSLARISDGVDAQTRHVKVGIINIFDTGQVSVDDVYLKTMQPYAQVFAPQKSTSSVINSSAMMTNFKQSLAQGVSGISHSSNIMDMINQLTATNSGIEPAVIKATEDCMLQLMNSNVMDDLKAQGYLEQQARKVISKVIIKNYMSHEYSEFNFVDGFNVIIGESNAGKTVLFRSIDWCLNDSPKGTSMMRTGSDHTMVRIEYTDGTYVQRYRTDTSPGELEIKDITGAVQVFKGFSNKIPVDVMNIHQMPIVNITDSLKQNLSYSDQLAGPFLITASSFDKASAIGKITGVDIADSAIKQLTKEIAALNKTVKTAEADLKSANLKKASYDYLPKLKSDIDYLDNVLQTYDKVYAEQQELIRLDAELTDILAKKQIVEQELSQMPDIGDLEAKYHQVSILYNNHLLMATLLKDYNDIMPKVQALRDELSLYPKDEVVTSLETSMKMLIENTKMISSFRTEMNAIHKQKKALMASMIPDDYIIYVESSLAKANTLISVTREIAALDSNYDDISYKISTINEVIQMTQSTIDDEVRALHDLSEEKRHYIHSIGCCPLCGTQITTEDQIQSIAKGGI